MLQRHRLVIIFSVAIFIIFSAHTVFAGDLSAVCESSGYTISAINGVFTDEEGARNNQRLLKLVVGDFYNGQKVDYQYLLNTSHIGGLGDILESVHQGLFDSETVEDYDLVEMLKSASEKVQTQKLLLVAHSQGNFYANSFYDTVADKDGGVPRESIGVYSVATPSGRVAGGGSWLTSDTDQVIAGVVGHVLSRKIMTPNTHITLQPGDDSLGHNFSSVYLKYRGAEIVADIKSALDQLQTNSAQDTQAPCLAPPKLTLGHEIAGQALAVADPAIGFVVNAGNGLYVTTKDMALTAYDLAVAAANGAKYAVNSVGSAIGSVNNFLTAIISQNFGTGGVARNPLVASMIPLGDNSPSPDAPAPQPPPAQKNKLTNASGSTGSPQAGQPIGQTPGDILAETSLTTQNILAQEASSPTNGGGGGGGTPAGSVSETPPVDQSNSTPPPEIAISSIHNFQAKFSTSTLQIDLSWSPLDLQNTSTVFVAKKATNQNLTSMEVIIETSSTAATFTPPDLHRSYDFSIQAFDGDVATSSISTTTINVPDFFARPSPPANFSLGSFDAFNSSVSVSWSTSTDPDTPDNLLSYEFNYASSTELLSDGWVATPSFQKNIHVDFPNTYYMGIRAKDDFGNTSPPSILHWNFPDGFVPLPSQLDHAAPIPGASKQSITIVASTTIDVVAMWFHGNGGITCCSQSYMRILAEDGTLVATSDDTAFRDGEEHEGFYHFLAPVALAPGVYWLVPTKGPSENTNGTWYFGSPGDTYPGGAWTDSTGADTGIDAYFRLRPFGL